MCITNKKIAILGATSHIAKGLIYNFNQSGKHGIFLFARSINRLQEFLKEINWCKNIFVKNFEEVHDSEYDVVINCVGIGNPSKLKNGDTSIFVLTETFDNLVLDYLRNYTETLYINFSSGAAYGTDFSKSSDESTLSRWNINNITESDYYGIAKLNSEAKHRALKNFNIIDLRIFGYFSRFISLESKFLLTEIISCIKEGKEFVTGGDNIIRDYIHPKDLFSLVEKCIQKHTLNDVYDAYSLKPIAKFEVLNYFASEYGLKYVVKNDVKISGITGSKNSYYSNNKKARNIGYIPRYTSLESISQELGEILN